MSRLDFAPKLDQIKITDIKRGLGAFTPKPEKAVSFIALKGTLKKAGYALASAELTVAGTFLREDSGLWLEADVSKQRFALEGERAKELSDGMNSGTQLEVTGGWETIGEKANAREVIHPREVKPRLPSKAAYSIGDGESTALNERIQVSIGGASIEPASPAAPVRMTSPGLTVYKGGAFIPRYFYIRQSLGSLRVSRNILQLAVSYTPATTLQLEAIIPFERSSFEDGPQSGSDSALGDITVYGKYRFYRTLDAWGDRQAAVRIGVGLPTGQKDAPEERNLQAPEFVRRQLSAINGGLAFHTDLSYSQAHGRLLFGGGVEATLRSERDGFRTGHEVRVNTDLEYVLLPLNYQTPGKELFVILETSYAYRDRGRAGGRTVAGSSSSQFSLAPGLQFTATPRLVLEASLQFPVVMNSGPLVLRTDKNLLVGIRYLY